MLTTTEAAAVMKVSQSRVLKLVKAGRIRAVKQGRDWVITEAELKRVQALPRPSGRPRKLS